MKGNVVLHDGDSNDDDHCCFKDEKSEKMAIILDLLFVIK